MANLVKLYTYNQCVLIDTTQLSSGRTQLTIYTLRGNRLYDTKRGQNMPCCTVHKDNLFASKELAKENMDRIYKDMKGNGE